MQDLASYTGIPPIQQRMLLDGWHKAVLVHIRYIYVD